jgi:hypothetical protein
MDEEVEQILKSIQEFQKDQDLTQEQADAIDKAMEREPSKIKGKNLPKRPIRREINYKIWEDVVLNLAGAIACQDKEKVISDWLEEIRKSDPLLDTRFMVKTILMPEKDIVTPEDLDYEC